MKLPPGFVAILVFIACAPDLAAQIPSAEENRQGIPESSSVLLGALGLLFLLRRKR